MSARVKCAAVAVLAAAVLALALRPASADPERGPAGTLVRIWRAVKGETSRIDADAMRVYEEAPRAGSCEERRARILAVLPDALRFARLARAIGEEKYAAKMKTAGLATLEIGSGRTAHFTAAGERYAEVDLDPDRRQAVVVFQGTRLAVRTDVSTDVLSFIGLQTGYYRWAAALVAQVVREHPGVEVVAVGHSLGGGLAIYAVLRNPGVKGFAFNPAGLSLLTWTTAAAENRMRANAALTVVSTRSGRHIEPVTAVSLAGRSVLPGHVLVLDSDALGPVALHSAAAVVAALEQVEAGSAAGAVCDADLGELVD